MKRKFLIVVLLIAGVTLSTSCSKKILFTNKMRYNLHDNHVDLGKVQFYNSKKIVLKRNLTYEETKVAEGKIRLENGKYMEEIIIPKNTPGILISEGKNYLNIAFERGRDRDLKFLQNMDNYFQLSALNWDHNGYGRVKYDSSTYYILPSSSKALLQISKDVLYNSEKKTRKLKGIKITN